MYHMGFPGGSVEKNPQAKQETWLGPSVRKILWRRKWQLTLVFLPKKPWEKEGWQATVHGVAKNKIGLRD